MCIINITMYLEYIITTIVCVVVYISFAIKYDLARKRKVMTFPGKMSAHVWLRFFYSNQNNVYILGPLWLGPGIGSLFQVGYIKLKYPGRPLFEKLHEIHKVYGKTIQGQTGLSGTFGKKSIDLVHKSMSLISIIFTIALTEDMNIAKEVLNSPDFSARWPSHSRFKEPTYYKNLGCYF